MRRPALVPLAVAGTALALALSAAAPGLADDTASPATTTSAAPADPTAPVLSTTSTDATTTVVTEASATPTAGTPTASPTPQIGGNGAFSYPFVLTSGEGGASTVAIEVAGTGISLGYTLDEQGKVTDAVVAGTATLVKATPHTVKLLLEDGTTVMVKVHGDAVRVKVKPRKGGPLRPGITTTEQAAADAETAEAATAEVEATESPEADDDEDEGAKKSKAPKAKKDKKGKAEKAKGKKKKD